MVKFRLNRLLLLNIAAIFLCGSFGYASESPNRQNSIKFKFGFSERFRIETWDNSTSLNNSAGSGTSYTRNRTSFSSLCLYKSAIEANLKITNEFRNYFVPENRTFDLDELFIDQLNLKIKVDSGMQASLTIGRQNLMFGEGFIIMDGGPLDGSRSGHFDAIRIDLEVARKKSLSCFYTNQQTEDRFLPVINDKDLSLNEQPEQMIGAYSDNDIGKSNIQLYLIHKNSKNTSTRPTIKVNIAGSRIQYPLDSGILLTGETAVQFGERNGNDIAAIGGYGYASWQMQRWLNRPYVLTLGILYLSGDDPNTSKYGGWDPLYGRYPKWSESYIYTLSRESGVAYWTNIFSIYARTQFEISQGAKLLFDYYRLTAPKAGIVGNSFPGGRGKNRGDLLTARLTYKLTKTFSGHIVWEYFDPGSYYFPGASHANWMRIEFMANL